MADPEELSFVEGQNAYEHGLEQGTCPYPDIGSIRHLWLAGWDEAQRWASNTVRLSTSRSVDEAED
ncbi:ribosome modulation factor [Lichenihabitans psoromatis]|uniref:ribosome modulation factor n=1 Tax=Lichenihabitans psoromatis TaxID=2528642 RepID=UPI001036A8FB|nr:Rmf/CrpP family protein [Lichenihabitans psoromatis]